MVIKLLTALLLSLFISATAQAVGPQFDVVFDLDWTLFYVAKTRQAPDSIQVGEEYYRLADGSLQVIAKLHADGHRVSLFSGGTEARNLALAEFLQKGLRQQGVKDFRFYKILHYQDLTPRPGAPEGSRFSERLMKNLSLVNPNLNYVVLVDDVAKFSVPGQEKNMYYLGKTYEFQERYQPSVGGEYAPPNVREWRRERNKIRHFYRQFKVALSQGPAEAALDRLQLLSQGPGLCSKVFTP